MKYKVSERREYLSSVPMFEYSWEFEKWEDANKKFNSVYESFDFISGTAKYTVRFSFGDTVFKERILIQSTSY